MMKRRLKFLILSFGFIFLALPFSLAEDRPASGELIVQAWDAHGKKDVENTFKYTQQLIDLYKAEADQQQASLSALPKSKEEIMSVQSLNDVATAYFIQAESYRNQGKNDEAIKSFKIVVDNYNKGQAWDPRGWYWQVAKAAQESIDKLVSPTGTVQATPPQTPQVSQRPTKIVLYDSGKEDIVDYQKYGEFKNIGTKDYQYIIKDQEGLSAAVGESIYPNTTSVRWDPEYLQAKKDGRLAGNHWDFVQSPDLEAAFLRWSMASEPQGVKLFYIAFILEKAGLYKQAIKAYYAIVVHFPGTVGWTYWHTPWYVGQTAIYKIKYLCRKHPELKMQLRDAKIRIINGYDNDISNDIVETNPGKIVKAGLSEKLGRELKLKIQDLKPQRIKTQVGDGKVHLVQYESGDWQLFLDNQPYIIKGITYAPTKVCQSPDDGTLGNWMEEDFNKNGKIDGPYDSFVDKNGNNIQDADERPVGDFQLMKEMGVNTIRLYYHPKPVDKNILRDLYKNYGIRVIIGDFLGKYAIGSGAKWNPGTDYTNEEQKKNMMASVTSMVLEFKDEPYVLFWLLGNENVYGYACNADKEPDAFFKFANEVAKTIKSIDKNHPVAICSGDTLYLDKFGKNCPDIDIFGTNAYRGNYGFGYLWQALKEEANKPVFITEYGCPAHAEGKAQEEAEELQAGYHQGCWEDIEDNFAGMGASGNSIGGVVFEWMDEWWKAYEPCRHDTKGLFTGPFPDGYMHEEWLGVCGQGDGKSSPFLRHLRKAYYMYKKVWR